MSVKVLLVAIMTSFGFVCNGAELPILVKDESGAFVSGAEITVYYHEKRGVGQVFGFGKTLRVSAISEGNGMVRLNAPSIDTVSIEKSGYYPSSLDLADTAILLTSVKNDPSHIETVTLRKILNPVPMYVRRVGFTSIPGVESAFDLVVGDWVRPKGKGEIADLIFKVNRVINGQKDYSYDMLIAFNGGAMPMKDSDLDKRSVFKFPYNAPKNGYLGEIKLSGFMQGMDGKRDIDGDRNAGYIFCIMRDVVGGEKRRMFGKIIGGIQYDPLDSIKESNGAVSFVYYLNPQGSGLEWDTKNNLFPDVRINPEP